MGQFERKEFKYYVPVEMLEPLRQRILTHMGHDPFCQELPKQRYTVRSIYFDTRNLLFYFEKLDGLKIRKKLRVRTYNSSHPNSIAFLEIKRKIDSTIFKERAQVSLAETPNLMNGAQLHLKGNQPKFIERTVLDRFVYLFKRLKLEPKALITYEREALKGLTDPSFRVTFDFNVRSYPHPDMEEIFREQDLRVLANQVFILEVKFYESMPVWMRNIIRDFKLRVQSISKYCNGLDVHLPSTDVREFYA
jgi:SPX domain protein involved in polyphosphate accumulation